MPTQHLTRNRRAVHHSSCQKAEEREEPFSQEQSREDACSLRPRPQPQVTGLRASVGGGGSSPPDPQAASVSRFPADSNLETPSGPPREDSAQLCEGNGSRAESRLFLGFSETEQDPTVLALPPAPSGPLPVFCGST